MKEEKIIENVEVVETEKKPKAFVEKAKNKISKYGKKVGIAAAIIGVGVLGVVLYTKFDGNSVDYVEEVSDLAEEVAKE